MYYNDTVTDIANAVENIFSYEHQYEEDVPTINYDDEDAFSDVDYDSDECEAKLYNKRYDDESEDEIWEDEQDEQEDQEIANTIRLQLLREKHKKELEGLTVLDGKLNWLEKVPVIESDLDNDDYPILGAIVKPSSSKKPDSKKSDSKKSPTMPLKSYMPAMNIKVCVGKKTYIEFEHVICKSIKEGKTCTYGDKCKFSHNLPKLKVDKANRLCNSIRNGEECKFKERCRFSHELPKTDYNRLCNFIRNGEECKFKERCRFSHDVDILKRKPSGERGPKPMCRNGIKCENRKCTFTHPTGHKKAPQTLPYNSSPRMRTPNMSPRMRTPNMSPRMRTPNMSPSHAAPLEPVDRKFLLCKNMFQIENGAINMIGKCRFGNDCKFAHGHLEVEKRIKDNLIDFECKQKVCKGVEIKFIIKKDKDGKDRKTRRYNNSATRKCPKIHEKERVTDFIIRTQSRT